MLYDVDNFGLFDYNTVGPYRRNMYRTHPVFEIEDIEGDGAEQKNTLTKK